PGGVMPHPVGVWEPAVSANVRSAAAHRRQRSVTGRSHVDCQPRRTLQRVTSPSLDGTSGHAASPHELTHVDATGAARMVDVSVKDVTVRLAVAAGTVRTAPDVVALLRREALPKGDALAVARIAGL